MVNTARRRADRRPPYALPTLFISAFVALATSPREASPNPSVECRASFDPGRVVITETRITIEARFNEPIGRIDDVEAEAASGIESLVYEEDTSTLAMDTGNGSVGTWTIRFVDEVGVICVGTLTLGRATR